MNIVDNSRKARYVVLGHLYIDQVIHTQVNGVLGSFLDRELINLRTVVFTKATLLMDNKRVMV